VESPAVPFQAKAAASRSYSIATIEGVARVDPGAFVLEFVETRRGVAGSNVTTRASEITTLHIPFADLESVDWKRRFLGGGTLTIRTRKLGLLTGLAGPGETSCTVQIHARDAVRARALAASVAMAQADEVIGREES
jgi:hypothetical protein